MAGKTPEQLAAEKDARIAELEKLLAAAKTATVVAAQPVDFKEYPKCLYFKGDPTNYKVVDTADQEDALGADWIDAPTAEPGSSLMAGGQVAVKTAKK